MSLEYPDLIRISVGTILFWIGVYLVSRNIRSVLAWILFLFLFSLSAYIVFVDVIAISYFDNLPINILLERATEWTYLLPIPIVLHLSMLVTKRANFKINTYSLTAIYVIVSLLILAGLTSDLLIREGHILYKSPGFGYFSERGPLFPFIAIISFWASALALWNYVIALRSSASSHAKRKFAFAATGAALYAIIGPFLVYIYSYTTYYEFAVYSTSPLLIIPVVFWVISIFFFRLVSDVEDIFNLREFVYLTVAIVLLNALYSLVFFQFADQLGRNAIFFIVVFIYIAIFTHAFYDWLTTFIRDLLYNAGKGFSLITDSEVNDLIRNYHAPEKIEASSIVRFGYVKNHAESGRLVDSAQSLIRDAIEYFKQPDFPRRTKQNLKYQILKMTTIDGSEEGQILWELGFDGYPMKILTGEDSTRKPIFRVESMSDYTATSRNAFIALKKEAVHDLAWRLSYLERTAH